MEEKNIMILSMSTLPSKAENITRNQYFADDFQCDGVSQLEPGTKYFLWQLNQENKKFDRIYIIASEASERSVAIDITEKISQYLSSAVKTESISAVTFFEERIRQYILEEKLEYDNVNELFREIPMYDESAESKEEKNYFLYNAINILCQTIKREKPEDGKINLFINMQGGRRNETFIINTTVEMLETDDIVVTASNAEEYSQEKKNHQIVDTTINDRILELVSGMNEFIETGRGNTLKKFWSDPLTVQKLSLNKEEKEIIDWIGKISDAISLCSVEDFDINLSGLRKTLRKYSNIDEKNKNLLFDSLVSKLQDDYDKFGLLSGEKSNTINQIEWCRSKKLYQQALTLLESKIPDDIVNDNIIVIDGNVKIEDLANKIQGIPHNLKEDLDKHEKINFVWIKYAFNKKLLKSHILSFDKDKLKNIICDIPNNNEKELEKVTDLLDLYYEIAKIRNLINHASSDIERPNVDDIDLILREFTSLYREILNNKINIGLKIVITDNKEEKANKTLRALPIERDSELQILLDEIWKDDQQAIEDFKEINAAVLSMKSLTYQKFLAGKDNQYFILKQILDYLIRKGSNCKGNCNIEDYLYKNRFSTIRKNKEKRTPFIRLKNQLNNSMLQGFYPDKFQRIKA